MSRTTLLAKSRNLLIVLLIVFIIVYFSLGFILRGIGHFLVLDEIPVHSDAIVVLNTGVEYQSRLIEAADLYNKGYADHIIINGNRKMDIDRLLEKKGFEPCCPWYEDRIRVLSLYNVPREQVISISAEDVYDSTSEAEVVGNHIKKLGINKIIIKAVGFSRVCLVMRKLILAVKFIQPLPLPEVIRIMREMCEGLSFAHKNRIVHGNLRPSNIMFTESDHIKITDFGLDEHYDDQKEEANWYSREALMGSPQGDIFAIGTIIYQMLTGQLPVWKRRRLKPSKLFESNPANVQEIVINMLGVDQEGMDVNLDQVIAQIDDLGIISDKTMVLAGGAGTLSNKQNDLKLGRIFSLFIITNMILALSVVAYLAFTGQIEIDHKTLGTFLETTKEFFRHFWEQALAYSEKGMEFMRKVLGKTG